MTNATFDDYPTKWGHLPLRMRVLLITSQRRTGAWLAEALAADSACDVFLEEADGAAAGLAILRDRVYDTVIVSHTVGELDATELLPAIRTGTSAEQAIVVLGEASNREMAAVCFEAGADAYLSVQEATIRELIWQVARATQRHRLIVENERLRREQKKKQLREIDETLKLLTEQKSIADKLNQEPAPKWLIDRLSELLQTYVVMGTGNLTRELHDLANRAIVEDVSSNVALQAHLHVVSEAVEGLGNRSSRHVMNRANLLLMELLVCLAAARELPINQAG